MASRGWMMLTAAFAFATAFLRTTPAKAIDCTDDTACAGTRTPKCLTQFGICGCESDQQCGDATSGLICTRPAPASDSPPYCTAGCVVDGPGPRNTCEPGTVVIPQTCSDQDGGVGICTQSCVSDPLLCGTTNSLLRECKGTLANSTCVECIDNTQCAGAGKAGARVCDTTTGMCVQCNADTDCGTNPNGPICRTGNSAARSCGCNNPSDCGPNRTCDPIIKACIPIGGGDAGTDGATDASTDGATDGSTEDSGDGSTGDGSTDGATDARADAGRADAGDGGFDGGGGGDEDGNYGTSLNGGGCDCSVSSVEDSLPLGGLLAVGAFFTMFARRRAKKGDGQA